MCGVAHNLPFYKAGVTDAQVENFGGRIGPSGYGQGPPTSSAALGRTEAAVGSETNASDQGAFTANTPSSATCCTESFDESCVTDPSSW